MKWYHRDPNMHQFKNEIKIYIFTLEGLTNKKATRTIGIYKALKTPF